MFMPEAIAVIVAIAALCCAANSNETHAQVSLTSICQTCADWQSDFFVWSYGPGATCRTVLITNNNPLVVTINSSEFFPNWSGAYADSDGKQIALSLETSSGTEIASTTGRNCATLNADLSRSEEAELGHNYVFKVSCESLVCSVTLSYKVHYTSLCSPGCYPYMIGDGVCDKECNNTLCERDQNDCARRVTTSSSSSSSVMAIIVPIVFWILFMGCIVAKCRRSCRRRWQTQNPNRVPREAPIAVTQPYTVQVPPVYSNVMPPAQPSPLYVPGQSLPQPPPPYVPGQSLPPPPPLPSHSKQIVF